MCSEVSRRFRKPLAGLLLLAALTLTAGCGKKGPPLPPLRFVPATAKDLIVSQQGTRILLNFAYPKVTAAGQALGTVTEVDVYEVTRPVPGATAPPVPTPAPGATTPTPPAASTVPGAAGSKAPTTPATPPPTTATPSATTSAAPTSAPATTPPTATAPASSATTAPAVPATPSTPPATPPTAAAPAAPSGTLPAAPTATTPAGAATPVPSAAPAIPAAATAPEEPPPLAGREYTSSAKVRLKLKGAEVGAATQGDRIVVELPYPEKTEVHYFTVKTLGPHGDPSGYSNQVVILPRPAPAPPADTKIMARADGVEVTWTEPAAAPGTPGSPGSPASPKIIGYNIYRRYSQTKAFGPALHAAAATDRSYVDTSAQYGQGYIYTVTAVAHRDPVVESAIKTEGEIKYIDRFPPPVPREPVALVEPGRVRVVWRGSEAIDLAGYKIYRLDTKKAKGEYELLTTTPITEVEYTDSTVKVGGTYAYRITAIDQLGNESEPAEVRATAQ